MHVVHVVVTDGFAGVERYAAVASAGLARRGHRVTIVGGDPERTARALAGADGEVVHRPAASVPAAVRAVVAGERPDVVHAHMTAADLVALATRPVVRAPVVSTLHFAKPRGSSRVRRALWAPMARLVAEQVAISDFVARSSGLRCTTIPNAVPDPGPPPPPEERRPVVLVAQRLEAEKATTLAVDAWAASGLADRGWELHVAGEGSEAGALADRARRRGVEGSIRWLGFVDDLDPLRDEASILLATAPAEPFGLSVVEAMAAGLPVVAARGGGHLETLGPVRGAALFRPGDAAAGAVALAGLAADPRGRARYGERLRARYEQAYTVDRHVDALERVYARAVGGPPARSAGGADQVDEEGDAEETSSSGS